MRWMVRSLVGVVLLLVASPAAAAPVMYGASGVSTITVQARQSTDNALVFDETLALSTSSFVEWDAFGVPGFGGPGTINDMLLEVVTDQGPFSTITPYGPFDEITIDSASITPDLGVGFDTLFTFPAGGSTYSIQVGSVNIDAFYTASNSVTAATSGSVPAIITGVTNPSGAITLGVGSIQLEFSGIVMGMVDGTPFGEAGNNLILSANIAFFGDSSVVPTPEPSTGLLLAMGLAGLGARRRQTSVQGRADQ